MNIDIGALLSPSVGKGLVALAGARAHRIKHVPMFGAELYANGVPMDEAQFRSAFGAYQSELETLPPPAERDEWQTAQQRAASQRLAVITGTHPHGFPNFGDPDQAWRCTGTTIPTRLPLSRAATDSGCFPQVRSRQTDMDLKTAQPRIAPRRPPRLGFQT